MSESSNPAPPTSPSPLSADPWRKRVVTAVGVVGMLMGAKFGYDIGVHIAAPWLGLVMGLNTALFAGLVAAIACDRVLRALRLLGRKR